MSLVRAFTTRRNKPDMTISAPTNVSLGRAASQRNGKPIFRSQISSPVALVSTTNMLSYNAPSIAGTAPVEYRDLNSTSSSASSSGEDSDGSAGSLHSRETVTDLSSVDESPISPNHLSSYFKPNIDTTTGSPDHSPPQSTRPSFDLPHVPRRAPSHSKRAHVELSRKRSIQRMQSPPATARELSRTSADMFSPTRAAFVEAPRENPFGKELAQLDAVAEEFGNTVRTAEADADAVYMEAHGLAHFGASDYMSEIRSLIGEMFTPEPDIGGWI